MNYIKLLNPFLKLQQPTIFNAQTTFLKCIPFEKIQNTYSVNNLSLTNKVRKFATCPVKHKDPLRYNEGSETILDQLRKNHSKSNKNCIKIKDVFVMVRRDNQNNRRITIKLTKEYLKQIPLKSPESITKAVIMKNKKEIVPAAFIDNTAKYLNSLHDCCMQNKSPTLKSVSFSDYLPKKNLSKEKISEEYNGEKDKQQIDIKNNKKHIFGLITGTKNKINPKEEKFTEDKIAYPKSTNANAMPDVKVTQYLLNTKNYLNKNCITTDKSSKVLSRTKYITEDFKHLPTKSIKNEIQNLLMKSKRNPKRTDINQKEKVDQSNLLAVDSSFPAIHPLLLDANNNPSKHKLIQMSMIGMVLNSSFFNRDAVKNILESNQNRLHCGSLLHPQISISNLITNKVGGRYCKITSLNINKKNCWNDKTCTNKAKCQTTNAVTINKPNKKTCCANSDCVIKKCLSAVRTFNKDNQLEKYLENLAKKPNNTITNENIQNILKNREERMKNVDDYNMQLHPTLKQPGNRFEKSLQPCNNHKDNHPPVTNFAAKCKILKISIAELLSNLDYLNKQPKIEAFSQCIKFADDLEKQQLDRNKVLASEIPIADLIANKVKILNHTPYIEDKTKEEGKHLKNKENTSAQLEKLILQNSSSTTCKTQIGSSVPVYSYTTKC